MQLRLALSAMLVAPLVFQALSAPQGIGSVARVGADDAVERPNGPPTVTSTLPSGALLLHGEVLRFTLTVTDPDGDPVSLKLLNPLPGITFHPAVHAPSPLTREVRWQPPSGSLARLALGGIHHLQFVARSLGNPTPVRHVVDVTIEHMQQDQNLLVGDVTGDGVLDVVGATPKADPGGIVDQGAIHVWAGASRPSGTPTATLSVPELAAGDELGRTWPASSKGGQGIQLQDVTGDGVLDVVVVTPWADVDGLPDAGALHVWEGGAGLAGAPAPYATLTAPDPIAQDRLGHTGGAQAKGAVWCCRSGLVNPKFADVTGDGIEDLIVGALDKDLGGKTNTGAIYVWAGGRLAGTPAPHAVLQVPASGNQIGDAYAVRDVTGDGVCDVIDCHAVYADPATIVSAGLHVWPGGAGLSGDVLPAVSLTVPPQAAADPPREIEGFADVTGDGFLDILTSNEESSAFGPTNAGVLHVWAGGPGLLGATGPTAVLRPAPQAPSTYLGRQGIQVADVTGDGILDVVSAAPFNAPSPTFGTVYVWEGGGALSGAPAPRASLSSARLADANNVDFLQFAELTGDGVLDLVASADDQVLVYAGGAALSGAPAPRAQLRTDPYNRGQRSILLTSLTDDGDTDVLIGGTFSDGIALYEGGPGLTGQPVPVTTFRDPAGAKADELGSAPMTQGIRLADVTGDGRVELIAVAPKAPGGTPDDPGVIYVWETTGLAGASSKTAPTATLVVPDTPGGKLTNVDTGGGGLQLADLDGDGILDIVAGDAEAKWNGVARVGAVHVWKGRPGLAGELAPDVTFHVPGASVDDHLCALHLDGFPGNPLIGGCGLLIADVTGDGKLDVVAGAAQADLGPTTDAGAIYVFGSATGGGPLAPLATLLATAPAAGDKLGF